jgi:tripartite-type tricarboxylate transporter receptor subunit TctC
MSRPYDAIKDFAPVALAAYVPNVLTVHPSLPVANLGEFIIFVRTRPGQILYSSSGNGTTLHLAAVLFDQLAGTKMVHVPYKGSGTSLTDLVSGQVHVAFATVPTMLPFISAGRLRPLAVTSAKRSTILPKIPTIAEAAFPAYEVPNWVGLVAPAQTPTEIVQKLNSEVVKFMHKPDAKQRLLELGAEPPNDSPQVFRDLIARGYNSFGKLIRSAGVQLAE